MVSQSLLIQRSYSYRGRNPGVKRGPCSVAIPSYSEVLFLLPRATSRWRPSGRKSRNPFLFRGPIPTGTNSITGKRSRGRNPFLFRGPIPTEIETKEDVVIKEVAIPSYSEVLFLRSRDISLWGWMTPVAIPSYSEVLFLLPRREERRVVGASQSLLIQRSYSYARKKQIIFITIVAIPSYSEVLFLRRSF